MCPELSIISLSLSQSLSGHIVVVVDASWLYIDLICFLYIRGRESFHFKWSRQQIEMTRGVRC